MGKISKEEILWKALKEAADVLPDRTGWICRGVENTFKEFDEITDRIACGMLKLGFRKGDRVGLIALTQLEWVYTFFAAAKIGVTVVSLSIRYRDSEIQYILSQSESRALVTLARYGDMDYVSFFDSFRSSIPTVKDFIFIEGKGFEGSLTFDDLKNTEIDKDALDKAKAEIRPDDPVIIIYTSGTTGKPKGVVISNKSLLASARAQAEHTNLSEDDSAVCPSPLNHVGGLTTAVIALLIAKSKLVLVTEFNVDEMMRLSKLYRPTWHSGVPTMHVLYLMNKDFETWDRSSVRLVTIGGSNAEPDLLKKLINAFPNARIMNIYGATETSGLVVMTPWDCDYEKTISSIGKTIGDFQVKVIDHEGNILPPGETGELCIKGDAASLGYYKMPEETKDTFDENGWLHTGDLAAIDEEGYIYLKGRTKEMYIQGGFNVYPVEIENIISAHPKVQMVAGIGVPDKVMGEVGRYYIVTVPGSDITEDEIKAYCREHMANYKVPKQIVFRKELPLTPIGKIAKIQLKRQYEETGE